MELLRFLATLRTPAADVIFQGITYLAQEVIVIAVVCWLFWCANKKLAYTVGFSFFASGLLIQGLKITFRIPRPWILDPSFSPVESAVAGATGYSFPSGHTQSITALFGVLALTLKKQGQKILCWILILAVAFSRMYLGVHTPKDVGVSFLLSFACCLLCKKLFYAECIPAQKDRLISFVMLLSCVLLALYSGMLYKNGTIEISYAQDCFKAAGAGLSFSIGYYIEKTHIRFSLPSDTRGRIRRLIFGLLVTLLLQTGLKPVLGASLFACLIRYFLVVLWILVLYPLLFTWYAGRRAKGSAGC